MQWLLPGLRPQPPLCFVRLERTKGMRSRARPAGGWPRRHVACNPELEEDPMGRELSPALLRALIHCDGRPHSEETEKQTNGERHVNVTISQTERLGTGCPSWPPSLTSRRADVWVRSATWDTDSGAWGGRGSCQVFRAAQPRGECANRPADSMCPVRKEP